MLLKLKGKRVEKGLTQQQMAEKLDISIVTYNHYEKGLTYMTSDIIIKVLAILDCKFEDIFFE